MGNNQSQTADHRERKGAPQTPHTTSTSQSHARDSHHHNQLTPTTSRQQREPRRRESIQALAGVSSGTGKAAPAPPTPSNATAEPYKSSHANPTASSSSRIAAGQNTSPDLTRPTTASSKSSLGQQSVQSSSRADTSASEQRAMGNEQSKQARAAKDGAPPPKGQKEQSTSQQPPPEPVVRPVDVPSGQHADRGYGEDTPMSPDMPYSLPPPSSGFSRPPRLPLPIEEEEHRPGSPDDLEAPREPLSDDPIGLPRRGSMLSQTTVDDEEADEDGQGGLVGEAIGPSVPTVIEWRQPGERVYVTGTFAAWDKKFRLKEDGPTKGILSATINLQPGTHHIKFIVDGDMRLSDNLPTAVDFTNILVNYIEVQAHDRRAHASSASSSKPAGTDPIAITRPHATGQPEASAQKQIVVPPGVRPPQALPQNPELEKHPSQTLSHPSKELKSRPSQKDKDRSQTAEGGSTRMATRYYHNIVPQHLLDLDKPDDSADHRRSEAVSDSLPTPPTLPLFLGKSVLNGAMPMKDDASVLVLPNHTVLNHLATSSIRSGVLATSATTRYKQKFLTTIIYKPTGDIGE